MKHLGISRISRFQLIVGGTVHGLKEFFDDDIAVDDESLQVDALLPRDLVQSHLDGFLQFDNVVLVDLFVGNGQSFDDGIVVVAKSDERSVEIENILPLLQDRNDRMGQFDQQPVPLVGRRNRFECNAVQVGLDPIGSFEVPADDELVQGRVGVEEDFFLQFETPFAELLADGVRQQPVALLATPQRLVLESATARPRYRTDQLKSSQFLP